MSIHESGEGFQPPQETMKSPVEEVNQDILRERVEKYKPTVEEFLKRPYLVWTGMPTEFDGERDLTQQGLVPGVLRQSGPVDGTKYPAEELNKKYRGGGMIIQPNEKDGFESYPVKAEGIEMNTKLSSTDDALSLNPELAKVIEENTGLKSLIQDGQVIGMVRSAPAQMIKLSQIGFSVDAEVVLPGKGVGQTKPAGEDAYLGIGTDKDGRPVYWLVNCDQDGLPVNYLHPEDIK
jgi:hypothetical protein